MKKAITNEQKQTLTTQIITDSVLGSFLQYMPNPDDIVAGTSTSYQTYRMMKTDPRIKSLLNKLKTTALNFPVRITQPESCPDEVFDFVSKNKLLTQKLYAKMKRMLSALDYGFSVSEVVWNTDNGLWVPDNIITRKPDRFYFDQDWNCYWNALGGRTKLDQNYKWLFYHHDPDDENPYGTSVLRCVYWAFMFKRAGYDFWLQATEKFSVKTIIALFQFDGDTAATQERANLIASQLLSISSGSAAAVGNVSDIKEVGMSGDLIDFSSLVDACDTQISYGLTGQSIATSKTDGGSLALGEVQADLFYEDAKGIALEIQTVMQKVINWMVELNYGDSVAAPQIEFDVNRRASFDQLIKAIDSGVEVSKDALYTVYGLPKPRDAADTFLKTISSGTPNQTEKNLSDSGKKKVLNRRTEIRIL
jgi:phage gp29-like protein